MKFIKITLSVLILTCMVTFSANGAEKIVLHGATHLHKEHAFSRTYYKFEELVKKYYDGDVEFVMHLSGELGEEKDYLAFMSQGISVDFAIVAPSNIANFAKAAPLMDMPFLFKDLKHWDQVLSGGVFDPIAAEILKNSDVMILGYNGGGVRNLVVNKAVKNADDLKGLKMRVMGAPIQARIFKAVTAAPSVIAYQEVYNAIQTGVIDGLENEAAGIEQMKFYEVAKYIPQTQHTITVRPFMFSAKTFKRLPKALQDAVQKAGAEASTWGRGVESSEDGERLAAMQEKGWLEIVPFEGREEMLKLAIPVQDAYAKELGAEDILTKIRSM